MTWVWYLRTFTFLYKPAAAVGGGRVGGSAMPISKVNATYTTAYVIPCLLHSWPPCGLDVPKHFAWGLWNSFLCVMLAIQNVFPNHRS